MSDRRAEADAALAGLGLSAAALESGDVPLARLVELAGTDDGPALIAALGELPSAAVAARLAELEPAVDRSRRRDVRRALYRLRQRGIASPTPAPTPAPPAALASDVEGLVSACDGRGDRLIWLIRSSASGGTLLVAAQVNEPDGLRDLQVVDVTRKQLRTARQGLARDTGLRLVPADWRVLDALVVEAEARGGAKPGAYAKVRARLTSAPPLAPVEPHPARLAPPDADEASTLVAASASLLEQPELRTWWPTPDQVAPFVTEIEGIRESPLVLSRVQQEERIRDVLRRASVVLFPPAVLARRLAGTAYVLAETGRDPAARQALAVADALRARPEQAADVPLVAALAGRAFGALAAAEARREDERKSALVMTPAELRARASSRPSRTRG